MIKKYVVMFGTVGTFSGSLQAVCPLCTLAVGAGAGFLQRLGVDDSIIGLWIGAVFASLVAWTIIFLSGIHIRFLGRKPLVVLLYGALFWWMLSHNNMLNTKIFLSIPVGIVVFASGAAGYNYIKAKNGGRANFPLQKVVMPLGLLMVVSLVLWCITK